MKPGDLVMTNHYGPDYRKTTGIIIDRKVSSKTDTCDILWAGGKFEDCISSKWMVVISEHR